MNKITTASDIEKMFDCVHREVVYVLSRSRPGEKVTIFLSVDLYSRLEAVHGQEIQHRFDSGIDVSDITLFGCKVETYADNGCSFYVTTAPKIEL